MLVFLQQLYPIAKIPTQEFPAADPQRFLILEAVATAFVSPEYVYLLRTLFAVPQRPN